MSGQLLEYVESGNQKSDTILFLLHGWPDGPDLWRNILPSLEIDYHCVNLALPTYESSYSQRKRWFGDAFFGPSISQVADVIFETIESVSVGYSSKKRALLSHDWGSFLAEIVDARNPGYFSGGLITIDVSSTGVTPGPWSLMTSFLFIAFYQNYLALNFCSFRLCEWLCQPFERKEKAGEKGVIVRNTVVESLLEPCFSAVIKCLIRVITFPPEQVLACRTPFSPAIGVLYFQVQKGIATRMSPQKYMRSLSVGPSYNPSVRGLYVYGAKKPFMFHSQETIERWERGDKATVVKFATAHWPHYECPGELNAVIRKYLVMMETGEDSRNCKLETGDNNLNDNGLNVKASGEVGKKNLDQDILTRFRVQAPQS